jgi:hypothetical protein
VYAKKFQSQEKRKKTLQIIGIKIAKQGKHWIFLMSEKKFKKLFSTPGPKKKTDKNFPQKIDSPRGC